MNPDFERPDFLAMPSLIDNFVLMKEARYLLSCDEKRPHLLSFVGLSLSFILGLLATFEGGGVCQKILNVRRKGVSLSAKFN